MRLGKFRALQYRYFRQGESKETSKLEGYLLDYWVARTMGFQCIESKLDIQRAIRGQDALAIFKNHGGSYGLARLGGGGHHGIRRPTGPSAAQLSTEKASAPNAMKTAHGMHTRNSPMLPQQVLRLSSPQCALMLRVSSAQLHLEHSSCRISCYCTRLSELPSASPESYRLGN